MRSLPRGRIPAACSLSFALALLLLGSLAAGVSAKSIAPEPGFALRLAPTSIEADTDPEAAKALSGLTPDAKGAWPSPDTAAPATLQLSLSKAEAKTNLLLVLEVERVANGQRMVTVKSGTRAGKERPLHQEVFDEPGRRTLRVTLPKGKRAVAIELGEAGGEGAVPRIHRARLFRLDRRGRNDYWLFLGASLTVGGIKPTSIEAAIRERFPGYDPYVVNEAVSGWGTRTLRKNLPEILARHPHARYVTLHIGGNNVSSARPYPGGAARIESDLVAILDTIVAAKKIPILSRLSFRAYKAKGKQPAVPPEDGGSGPYVTQIYDPLIARYCPLFFDRKAGRGAVDLYGYYREHTSEIGGDGVHLTPEGYRSWARLWLDHAGTVVYAD